MSLPPNIVSAVQRHIPESIRHASESGVVDLEQLRTTLVGDFQVQGVMQAQAEKYYHRSEALLREATLSYKYTCILCRRMPQAVNGKITHFVMSEALTCPPKWTRQQMMHFGLCRMHDSGPISVLLNLSKIV